MKYIFFQSSVVTICFLIFQNSVTGLNSENWQVVGPRTERRSAFRRRSYTCFEEQKKKKALKKRCQKRRATRGLPRRSPMLVLHSPKHASLRSSDGIRCISAGMIAPVKCGVISAYMASVTGIISDTWQVVGPERNGGASLLDEVILVLARRKRKKH